MRASVKYRVIHRFKSKYNIRDMCSFFGASRSGYYAWAKKVDKKDPDGLDAIDLSVINIKGDE